MKVKNLFLLSSLFLLSLMPLFGQGGGDFFFSYDGEDNPVFVQRIKWKGSPYASKYRFILKNSSDKVILDQEVKEGVIDLSLTFGEYTFRIATYNVLGKIENVGKWEKLSIKKAIIPKMGHLSPHEVFLDEWISDEFTLTGADFELGAKVYQCLLASKNELKIESQTKNKISFMIPKDKVLSGSTSIRVENPSGIYADIPLFVKNKKPVDFVMTANYPFFYLHGTFLKVLGLSSDHGGEVFADPQVLRVPAGLDLDLILYPYKSSQGDFGLGLHSSYRYCSILSDDPATVPDYITLSSHILDFDFLIYYRYNINHNYAFYLRTGAGVSFQFFRFDFQGVEIDPEQVSHDTMGIAVLGGLGFQMIPVDRMLISLGFDYSAYFGFSYMGAAVPYVGLGYQF